LKITQKCIIGPLAVFLILQITMVGLIDQWIIIIGVIIEVIVIAITGIIPIAQADWYLTLLKS
jgi:hypothetical protein